MREKIKLTANILFSGIGCQERGFENSGLFDIKVLNTSDINKESVLSYAAIHCGMTNEMVGKYNNYPSREEMAQYLTDINLGYDPEKNKKFDWFKLARKKSNDIEKYWLACKLTNNLGDISRIDELPYADFWTCSFPCFVEGTLILTENGYKPIEKIKIGDYVLTHKNQWKPVLKTMTNEADKLYKIKTMPSEDIHCTANHPFYVRKRNNLYNSKTSKRYRKFDSPTWIKAKDLSREYYVGTAINQKSELPKWDGVKKKSGGFTSHEYIENTLSSQFNMKEFWYVIGRYLGDGWIRTQGGIIICANDSELYQIIPYLNKLNWRYNIVKNKTINNIHIPFMEIGEYCLRFGRGASNKHLTSDILNLPTDLLKSFLEGLLASDGIQDKNGLYRISSVSREMIYELGQCVAKAYHRPFSIYFTQRAKTTVIEGRVVNQRDSYSIHFKLDSNVQDKAFYEDGYVWSPINDVIEEEYNGLVYNLEVKEDESYVVQNIIVHNCTDISVAGKMKGLDPDSGTRSSLLWENIKLLKKAKDNNTLPKYIMVENVKNLVSKKFIEHFNNLISVFDDLGFNTYWSVLNGKNCGVPQNRERVFVIAIRKDIDNGTFDFPKPFDSGLRLKDVLEESVDEKYYLSEEAVSKFKYKEAGANVKQVGWLKKSENGTEHQSNMVYSEDGYARTLVAGEYKSPLKIIKQVGQLYGTDKEPNPQAGRVYDDNGLSPTIDTCSGGNRMPKVIEAKLSHAEWKQQMYERFIEDADGEVSGVITNQSQTFGYRPPMKGFSKTLRAEANDTGIVENFRIRKLTPRECYKLMGLTFEDCDKAKDIGVADTHLYKQAGNGIITNCCELLAEHLYKAQYDNTYVCTDEKIVNFQKPLTD